MAKMSELFLVLVIVSCICVRNAAGLFAKRTVFITSFDYQLCRPAPEEGYNFRFLAFLILSTANGDLTFSGTFAVKENITGPLKAVVTIKRSVLGYYIPIPCINDFGSCSFDDVCEFGFPEDKCPPILEQLNFPCGCPIKPGEYDIPVIKISGKTRTRWASIVCGNYMGNIKIYKDDTIITCYDIQFKLEK